MLDRRRGYGGVSRRSVGSRVENGKFLQKEVAGRAGFIRHTNWGIEKKKKGGYRTPEWGIRRHYLFWGWEAWEWLASPKTKSLNRLRKLWGGSKLNISWGGGAFNEDMCPTIEGEVWDVNIKTLCPRGACRTERGGAGCFQNKG